MGNYIGNKPAERYTINGQLPDPDGNFQIVADDLNIAEPFHRHIISDIENLQEELDLRSRIDHEHAYVTSVKVGENTITGSIGIKAVGDISIGFSGKLLQITQEAATTAVANSVVDAADSTEVKTFIGTQAEWDAFTRETGVKYIVYIHA